MLEEAVSQRNLGGTHPLLFGVTVLTSFAEGELPGISLPIKDFAKHLAALASSCRLDGIVTSPMEAAGIKANFPTLKCLCPGIRPSFAQRFDQRRVATPAEAVAAGADYLVIGRPILEAENPKEALLTIREEMI